MPDDGVHVWWVRLADDPGMAEGVRALLSHDERERADRFRFPGLRADYTLARAILRLLLSRRCGLLPADLSFAYGPQGKPTLAFPSPVRFNLAHSGRVAVYAFTRERDVGIDVEQTRALSDLEQIARRFFSPAECLQLMRLEGSQRQAAFFDCWVRKEAYIKAVGGGLSIPLDSFRVSLAPGTAAALLDVRDAPGEAAEWSIHALSRDPEYHGAVALRARHATIQVTVADARDVLDGAGTQP